MEKSEIKGRKEEWMVRGADRNQDWDQRGLVSVEMFVISVVKQDTGRVNAHN